MWTGQKGRSESGSARGKFLWRLWVLHEKINETQESEKVKC